MAEVNDLYNLLSDETQGAIVKFTKDEQLAPLRNILEDILGKKSSSREKNEIKRDKKLDAKDKKIQKQLETLNKYTLGILNIQKENTGGVMGKLLGFGNVLAKAGKLLYQAGGMYLDAFKEQFKYLKQLSDAGVVLRDGYSETFALFSGMAKMNQENFAKMMIGNSRFISNYNQIVKKSAKSAEEVIASISSKINNQYAMDSKQVSTLATYFLDLTKYRGNQKIAQTDLITQTEKLSIQFKALAKATGMSVDNYIQLAKEQEKEIYIRQIMSDPTKAAKFSIMQHQFGTDAALWMETGIANEKVLQMMATPAGMQALNMARNTYQTAETDVNGLTDNGLNQIVDGINAIVDGPLSTLKEDLRKISTGQMYLAPEFHNALFGLLTSVTNVNKQGLNSIIKNNADKETSLINSMNQLTDSVDIIKELMIHEFLPNTKDANALFSAMGKGTDAIQRAIWGKKYGDLKYLKYGTTRREFRDDRNYTRDTLKGGIFGGSILDNDQDKRLKMLEKGYTDGVQYRTVKRVLDVAKNMQEAGLDIDKINEQLRDYGGRELQVKLVDKKIKLDTELYERELRAYLKEKGVSEEKINSRLPLVVSSMINAQKILFNEGKELEQVVQENKENKEKEDNEPKHIIIDQDNSDTGKALVKHSEEQAEQAKIANEQMKSENADNNRGKYQGVPAAFPAPAL